MAITPSEASCIKKRILAVLTPIQKAATKKPQYDFG